MTPADPTASPITAIPAPPPQPTVNLVATPKHAPFPVAAMLFTLFFIMWAVGFHVGMRMLPSTLGLFERDGVFIGTTYFSPETALIKHAESPYPVTELYWDQNQILRSIPENIEFLKDLRVLFIGSQKFTTLPESIGNLTNLEELYIYNTPLSRLPASIGNLTNLKSIDVVGGNLTEIPDSIGNLTNLENLNLAHNRLKGLPPTIGNLTNLRFLNITGNRIRTIPAGIPSGLNILFISDNPIPWKTLNSVGSRLPVYY